MESFWGVAHDFAPGICLISLMVFVVTKGPTSWPLFASIAVKFAPEQIHRSKRCQLRKLRQQEKKKKKKKGSET